MTYSRNQRRKAKRTLEKYLAKTGVPLGEVSSVAEKLVESEKLRRVEVRKMVIKRINSQIKSQKRWGRLYPLKMKTQRALYRLGYSFLKLMNGTLMWIYQKTGRSK